MLILTSFYAPFRSLLNRIGWPTTGNGAAWFSNASRLLPCILPNIVWHPLHVHSRSMLNPLLSTFSAPSPQQVPTAARLEGPVPNCANPSPNACYNANGSAYVCCSGKCAVPPGANPLCGQITPPVNTQVRFILCILFHWRYMFDLTD
jgi:hypothetical protein